MKSYPLISALAFLIGAAFALWVTFGLALNGQMTQAVAAGTFIGLGAIGLSLNLWRAGWRAALHNAGRAGIVTTLLTAAYVLVAGVFYRDAAFAWPAEPFTLLLIVITAFFLWRVTHKLPAPPAKRWPRYWHAGFIIFALLYSVLAVRAALVYAGVVNADGLAYMQIARQLAAGEFVVRAYWAPLYSYLMVPLLWLNVDIIVAAHLVTGFALLAGLGAIYVFGLQIKLSPPLSLSVLLLALPFLTPIAFEFLTPDTLEIAVVFFYLVAAMRALDHPADLRWGILCGIMGALAFYGRSYALPFFIVHFTLMIFLLIAFKIQKITTLKSWLAGIITCTLLVAPWVAAISARTGSLTLSVASVGNRAMVAPVHPFGGAGGIHASLKCSIAQPCPQPDDVLFPWEDHDPTQLDRWSPFESVDYLRHQVNLVNDNIAKRFSQSATIYLIVLVVGSIFMCLALLRNRPTHDVLLLLIMALSALIYLGGYTTTFSDPARYHWIPMILGLLMLVLGIDRAVKALRPNPAHAPNALARHPIKNRYIGGISLIIGLLIALLLPLIGSLLQAQADALRIEIDRNGSSGYLAADHGFSASGCVTVRWRADGINAIFLNDMGTTGLEQSREICGLSSEPIRFRIVHQDGTESTYELPVERYWTQPAVKGAVLLAALLTLFGLYLLADALAQVLQERPHLHRALRLINALIITASLLYLLSAIIGREWTEREWREIINFTPQTCTTRHIQALEPVIEAPFVNDSDTGIAFTVSFLTQTRSYGTINRGIFSLEQRGTFLQDLGIVQLLTLARYEEEYVQALGLEPILRLPICDQDYVLLAVPQNP